MKNGTGLDATCPEGHVHHVHPFKRISWTAVFIGALIGLGLSFLLSLFSAAIGLTAFNMSEAGAMTVTLSGVVCLLIGIISSMLVAGYAAGYLGRLYCPARNLGILYGFTTWTLALVLSAVIGVHVSSYITSYSNTISGHVNVIDDSNKTEKSEVKSSNEKSQKMEMSASTTGLAWAAFIVFALFFIGAVSCCAGACWGMCCKRDD